MVLLPFGFVLPDFSQLVLSLVAGAVWSIATYFLYLTITKNEVSRTVPAIGGILPIFTFLISLLFFPREMRVDFFYFLALFLLVAGSIVITLKKKSDFFQNFGLSVLTAISFGLGFFLTKVVYLHQDFLSGFVLMRIGGVLIGLSFLAFSEVRQTVFDFRPKRKKEAVLPFFLGQIIGGGAFVLQNYSVALAKINQIPLINALEGVRYVFLLFFIFLISRKFPKLLKEETTTLSLKQKILGILLISAGLCLLALL